MMCEHCSSDAVVILPGQDDVRIPFLIARGVTQRQFCLECAIAAGWPWVRGERGS